MRTLASVLAAHYLAAFTALGMPVFMPRVLEGLAPGAPDWLSGLLYVLPTVCTALTATAWGRLADRYGRKLSLMRAQAGLVLGFLMAGFAPNLAWFVCALIVQGTCGGSLAAANAYLATQAQGQSLTRALDWTQFSARLAMVTAPALLGLATGLGLAQTLYRYLAVLPLLALLLTWLLPADPVARSSAANAKPQAADDLCELAPLLLVQFFFYFAMVVTFPYFISYSEALGVGSDSHAGLYYSLPHLVYLVLLPWLRARSSAPQRPLLIGLGLFSLACLGHALLADPGLLAPARVLYGIGMLLAIGGLNRALSQHAGQGGAGRLFGRFDACGKWAGALGGVAAGALVHRWGLVTPFIAAASAGAIALLCAARIYLFLPSRQTYVSASDA
ncbi:MFS transporter [Dyella sp. LX-66]|uniref:MFS transporter n=1 Tax=unclassified Dyella TaxID=2634549 RepID=UPI001BE104A3|nr:MULTISPECIES: MFS transporter [unclassified Dyella]MBT2117006.1 MFS transporter [Dyella sp. LX-1]MBT2139918.1 MFS transporter [Dyella sp. LX-66]